jgi:hypothetical protein
MSIQPDAAHTHRPRLPLSVSWSIGAPNRNKAML